MSENVEVVPDVIGLVAAPAATATQIAVADVDELGVLIADGHEQGFVSHDLLVAAIDDAAIDPEQIHDLLGYLEEHGIELASHESETPPPARPTAQRHVADGDECLPGDSGPAADRPETDPDDVLRVRLEELRRAEVDLERRTGPGLAAPVPALDRPRPAAHRRARRSVWPSASSAET